MQPGWSNPAERIGPYRVLKQLGAGGMGEVFLAYDERLDRQVAIKSIRSGACADATSRERFRREARMAARLSHPAIVQVHDILQEGGTDFIVLEYVEGTSLRERIAQGPLGVREALALAREVADGLDAAHQQGIVHRDLKTENVLVTSSGRPKIADFGIAKRLGPDALEDSLTRENAVVGTCRSMSPEQARGEPVDHRTDLFALGILLYEVLTGRSPFEAENTLATLQKVIHNRQVPARELNPEVPQKLSDLVDQLLEKDPLLRPRNAGEVKQELDRLAATGVVAAQGDSGSATIVAPVRPAVAVPELSGSQSRLPRSWKLVAALGVLAVLVILAVGAAYRALRRPEPPLYVAVLAPEVRAGADGGEARLLASGVRVALLQGLVALEGISPQAFEDVDAVSGTPRQVAQAVAAGELVGSHLDCRPEVCRVSLTRRSGTDGGVLWADSFEVPTDDSTVVASAVKSRIQQGYAGHPPREQGLAPNVSRQDLDELLRLRERFESRREPTLDAILAGLAALRARSPRDLEPYLLEVRVLRRRFWTSRDAGDLDRALGLVQAAERMAPHDPRLLFELVDLALGARKLELAERSLEKLEPMVPGDARLIEQQARLLEAQGNGAEGLERMREAARLQPSAKRLHTLAQMELRHGEITAARQTLELLLRRSPDYADGLSFLAQIELFNGDLERAVQLYSRLAVLSPGMAELSNLGLAFLFMGRYADAEVCFRRVRDMAPNQPGLVLNLADVQLLLGRTSEAGSLYQRVLELIDSDPTATGPESLTVKAQALAHLGRGREAATAVQEALHLAPDQGPTAFEAALVYALLGEESSALSNVEKALRLGIGERWFSLPWFDSLRSRPDFQALLQQATPESR